MEQPLDHAYFNWLCVKVVPITSPNPFYWTLLKALHTTEFVWIVPGDSHRAEDGMELRRHFLMESGLEEDTTWRGLGCSILEMLVAFSRRAWFQTEIDPKEWFWKFMDNLGLGEMCDSNNPDPDEIADILYAFVWRTYHFRDQTGCLFPLSRPMKDYKTMELWNQFFRYCEDTHVYDD